MKETHSLLIHSEMGTLQRNIDKLTFKPVFINGFVSPHLDFPKVSQIKRSAFPDAAILLCTTSGELCNARGQDELYCDTPATWDNIILQIMGENVIGAAEIVSIPLSCEDLKSGQVDLPIKERVNRIKRDINSVNLSMEIRHHDTLAYIVFDGLSSSESFFWMPFMTAINSPAFL